MAPITYAYRFLKLVVLSAFMFGLSPAHADPIGPDCAENSCLGNVYTLDFTQVNNDPTHYAITFTIDTSQTTLDATDFIAQAAFKVTSSTSDIVSASLTSAPGTGWSAITIGGLNNNGCKAGNEGFICISDTTPSELTDGSTYTFVFDVMVTNANQWLLDDMAASIKVNFGPANGLITSEHITLQPGVPPDEIPEPQTLALLGLGLLGIAFSRRRRIR